MPRRRRSSGVRFVEDEKDCSRKFFELRARLFRTAADLSIHTGARVAVVMESKNGRFSSFGTPAAGPVVEAFLSGNAPAETGTNLQNELLQLEKEMVAVGRRKKEFIARTKEIQESSRMAKYVCGKEEDLDLSEFYELHRELSRIQEVIKHHSPSLHQGNQVETGGADAGNTLGGMNFP